MDEKKLLKDKIPHTIVDGKTYFSLDSIKEKYGDVKTKETLVIEGKKYVLAENVEQYTDFDKHMKQALNFNNKKKDK